MYILTEVCTVRTVKVIAVHDYTLLLKYVACVAYQQ